MRTRARLLAFAAAAAAGALSVARACAETHASSTIPLGWMTENADAVVLGRAADERRLDARGDRRELDLLVDESVRGAVAAGTTVVIVYEGHGEAMPWKAAGGTHLAFLKAVPVPSGAPPRWVPISGAFAVKPIPTVGPESRFPAEVRTLASLLGAEGAVAKPDLLREHLVAGMEDADPGFAWSAAVDFVRHAGLHAGLTAEQGARITGAFRRQPVGKATKEALALAVAGTADPSATRALVDAPDDPP